MMQVYVTNSIIEMTGKRQCLNPSMGIWIFVSNTVSIIALEANYSIIQLV